MIARLAIGPDDERWSAELWAQNLLNEDYYQVVVDQPLQSGTYAAFLGQPRFWGVTLRARY
jgi:outer membrane receptor protein involved in Fe transport